MVHVFQNTVSKSDILLQMYTAFSVLFAQSSACDKIGIFYLYCVCSILYVYVNDSYRF